VPGHQLFSEVAPILLTDEATLLEFHRKGWIRGVKRNEQLFMTSDQRYRAKYILHLQATKHLSDDEIHVVLDMQRPPYSAADVDEILKTHALASTAGRAGG
jgi:hypothetical protein